MPFFKGVIFFNADRAGFTETIYVNELDFNKAFNTVYAYCIDRAGTLGQFFSIDGFRVTDESTPFVSFIQPFTNDLVNQDTKTDTTMVHDYVTNAILVRAESADGKYRRQVWLRGVPDAWIFYDLKNTAVIGGAAGAPQNRFQALWLAYKNRLCATGGKALAYYMKVINKDPLVSVNAPIKAITAGADGNAIITTTVGGFALGDRIKVRGVKGKKNAAGIDTLRMVNGRSSVAAVALDGVGPGQVITTGRPIPNPIPQYLGGGTLVRQLNTYVQIKLATPLRFASRKTGRAFFVPRGRRRTTLH